MSGHKVTRNLRASTQPVRSRSRVVGKVKPPPPKSFAKSTKSEKTPPAKSTRISGKPRAKAKQRAPRTEAQYLARPETFKDTWERVIEAISKMRNGKVSLTQAAREARVSTRTVTKYGKSALRKGKSGKYVVKKNDRLLRILSIPTAINCNTGIQTGQSPRRVLERSPSLSPNRRYLKAQSVSRSEDHRCKWRRDSAASRSIGAESPGIRRRVVV
jgi:hypothetical protein